ncbi:molecular chaperone [Cronobacter sakazakii]
MSASKLFSKTTLMTLLISGGISWAQGAQAADTVQMTMTGIIQAPAASASSPQTGVVIEGTRVIYQHDRKENALTVRNQGKGRWIIQAWVDSDDIMTGKPAITSKVLFEVTPTLSLLAPNSVITLHVARKKGQLPADSESVYWLNIKATPRMAEQKTNTLAMAVNQRIKLFYRPAGLKAPTVSDYQNVTFSRAGNTLRADNPTPYWITFYSLATGGKTIDTHGRMLPPKGSVSYSLPADADGKTITWRVIDDRGRISHSLTSRLASH